MHPNALVAVIRVYELFVVFVKLLLKRNENT